MTNRKKKGISPVIATVMLLAVTLVTVLALGTFVFGLFGSSTSSANVSITSVSVPLGGATFTINFKNTGAGQDSVSSVSIPGGVYTVTPPATQDIPANANTALTYSVAPGLTTGQTYSMTVKLASGATIPYTFSAYT